MSESFMNMMAITPAPNGTPGCFVAPEAVEDGERTFGGQFLAQCLVAAQQTVGDDRCVNSLHAYFLRGGDVDQPLDLRVETIRDGRSFSLRQVEASQDGKELFRTTISFHVPEEGLDFAPATGLDPPAPESVLFTYNEFNQALEGETDDPWGGYERPMDIRYINPPEGATGPPVTEPQLMWMRISEKLPDDPRVHEAGVAYLADSTLVDHVVLPHGIRWQNPGLTGTSLDHAMWFRRRVRADEWLLYEQRIESTAGARGLATGRFYTESGELVATCAQEGLIRFDPTKEGGG